MTDEGDLILISRKLGTKIKPKIGYYMILTFGKGWAKPK